MELKYLLINSNKEAKGTNQEYLNLNNITEAETKTTIEHSLVVGIIIPLNTESIAL